MSNHESSHDSGDRSGGQQQPTGPAQPGIPTRDSGTAGPQPDHPRPAGPGQPTGPDTPQRPMPTTPSSGWERIGDRRTEQPQPPTPGPAGPAGTDRGGPTTTDAAQNPWQRAAAAMPPSGSASGSAAGQGQRAGHPGGQPPAPPPRPDAFGRPPGPVDGTRPSGDGTAAMDPTKRRRTLIIAALALLLVVVLVLVLVAVVQQRRSTQSREAMTGAVNDYLTAIAQGDSQRALGYLAERPDNTDLMSDAVLKQSNKIKPITGISVSEVDGDDRSVRAWYKVGSRRYQQQFDVHPAGDAFVIDGATASADLTGLPKGLHYRLNGQEVRADTVTLFPGSYRLTSTSPYLTLGSAADFAAQPRDRLTVSVAPKLGDNGTKAVRKAISSAVNACLGSTTLRAGCGLSVSDDGPDKFTVKDKTISRELSGDAERQLRDVRLFLDPGEPTVVHSEGIRGTVRTTATCEREKKGKKKTKKKDCTITGQGTSLANPTAKLIGDKITISWH